MCEIIALVFMCRSIGNIVAAKGRQKIGYQFMLVGLWFGGEILGAIAGVVLAGGAGGGRNSFALVYVFGALGGAILGAVIAFVIANGLSPIDRDDDYYRGDYYRGGYGRGHDRGYEDDYRRPEERPPPRGADDKYGDRPAPPPEDDRFTR